jgi:hypothetical protein
MWPGASAIQLVSRCNAYLQFSYPMQQFHNEKGFASWHIILPRVPECWSSHILSAMEGLTQSYTFKQKLLHYESIDHSWFVVDLRNRNSEFRTPSSDSHLRERNSKTLTCHQWCALPAQRAMVTHRPCRLPRYMLFDLPRDVISSVACFRLRVHTLRVETATWNSTIPLPLLATYVRLMIMSRMKSMFSFTARTLRWFLSAGSTAGSYFHRQDRRSFYTRKTTLIFFIHELIWLYEQASSYTSWLKAFFLVIFFLVILQTHLVTGFFSKLPLRCPPEAYIAM